MSTAKAYAESVKRQAKAQKALADAHEAWAAATDHSAKIKCRLATEARERELQARIQELSAAHAQYWVARAAELVPGLQELALVAAQYDHMMRASGCLTVEPWLQIVRGVQGAPLAPHVLGDLVRDVPIKPELSDEFDWNEFAVRDREKLAKKEKLFAKVRKWI